MKKSTLLSVIDGVCFTAASAAAFLSVLAIILTGQFISRPTAFMLLAFMFALEKMVLNRLSTSLPLLLELPSTLQRIERFLLMNEIPLTQLEYNRSSFGRESRPGLAPSMESLADDHRTVKIVSSENKDEKIDFTLSRIILEKTGYISQTTLHTKLWTVIIVENFEHCILHAY